MLYGNKNVETTNKWYDHKPATASEIDEVTILWNMLIYTDRKINASRPDIVIKDERESRCKVIDVAIPRDNNTFVKVAESYLSSKTLKPKSVGSGI